METIDEDALHRLLLNRASVADLAVDSTLLDGLKSYFRLLAHWNVSINLTGFSLNYPTDQAIDRLIVEPLLIAKAFKYPVSVWFDLGSGGGSPAIPIQLYRPAETLVLVESKERKAAFLREVTRRIPLGHVEVECERIEAISASHRFVGIADLVTIRAVRPSAALFASMNRLLRTGGVAALIGSKPDLLVHQSGFELLSVAEPMVGSLVLLSKT